MPATSSGTEVYWIDRFFTWDGTILVICTKWGMRGWRVAPQKEIWGFELMISWIWVNSVLWQQKRSTMSWGASSTA